MCLSGIFVADQIGQRALKKHRVKINSAFSKTWFCPESCRNQGLESERN
jgi:hypothetical protein